MWERILQSADIDWLRKSAEHHLLQFRALDQIDALQSRLDAFAKVRGGPPGDWATVLRARVVPRIPTDPSGTPYELTADGQVRLSRSSGLFPLPVQPEGLAR